MAGSAASAARLLRRPSGRGARVRPTRRRGSEPRFRAGGAGGSRGPCVGAGEEENAGRPLKPSWEGRTLGPRVRASSSLHQNKPTAEDAWGVRVLSLRPPDSPDTSGLLAPEKLLGDAPGGQRLPREGPAPRPPVQKVLATLTVTKGLVKPLTGK